MKQTFNDLSQQVAISLEPEPAIILAGPGSGKTYVITHRIKYLIQNTDIHPSEILVITFTKFAALEMKERFLSFEIKSAYEVNFSTFHSFFYFIIRSYHSSNKLQIVSYSQQIDILNKIISNYSNLNLITLTEAESLSCLISKYKNNIECFDYSFELSDEEKNEFLEIYTEYNRMLMSIGLIDYDDILLLCYRLLIDNPQYANQIKNRYKAILIDEFQDINEIQYEIVKLIYPNNCNIFVVGDDDQSIYGFRGSNPSIMKKYIDDFHVNKIVELKKNYRSTESIIEYSTKLISNNLVRMKANINFKTNSSDNLNDVKIYGFENLKDEIYYLLGIIQNVDNNLKIAILTRTNKDALYYKDLVSNNGILNNVSLKKEIFSDIKSYLDCCLVGNREAYIRVINKPIRYISSSIFEDPIIDLSEVIRKTFKTNQAHYLNILFQQIEALKRMSPFSFLRYLLNIVGYKKYILDKYKNDSESIENILIETEKLSKEFLSLSKFKSELVKKIDSINTVNDVDRKNNVSVMTFHASKGLEFDFVILPDVNEGKIPGRSSLKFDSIEEERRLFYVAMTRAKKKLIITYIKKEESSRLLPSRFIYELLN